VGGVGYAVGGWGAYEAERRRARWEATRHTARAEERPGARYAPRTYITADDAARSLAAGAGERPPGAVRVAALRLADALGRLEDRLCDPDDDGVWECESATALRRLGPGRPNPAAAEAARYLTVPPVTSADLRAFAEDPAQAGDPEALYDLGDDVAALAAAVGAALPPLPPSAHPAGRAGLPRVPPLPSRVVPVTDDEGVLRLEAAAVPYVASLEEIQAALAARLDAAAEAVGAALASGA
jgi:hypothetical protein